MRCYSGKFILISHVINYTSANALVAQQLGEYNFYIHM